MDVNTIRQKYIEFFVKRANHRQIPPAPLVPPDDPTTLFTSSGMQQMVPYLKGEAHPMGTRLVDSQPCFRADDIDEVGDNRHTTMFEMLGNWSLGDYFKSEQLVWFFEFLTQEIGLEKDRLYVTVFEGSKDVPKDEESIAIWQKVFNTTSPARVGSEGFDKNTKIYLYDAKKNWWSRAGVPENMPPGEIGGPDSEVFYDFDPEEKLHLHEKATTKDAVCHVNCDCGRFLEIGNSVFMQYEKQSDGSFKPLPKQNVDFGGGLERIVASHSNNSDVFKTDLFANIIEEIEILTGKKYEGESKVNMRIIADHLKAAVFLIKNDVFPSNKAQGYFLRRLIRRATVKLHQLGGGLDALNLETIADRGVMKTYEGIYFDRNADRQKIFTVLNDEGRRFSKALDKGLKQIEKLNKDTITGKTAFDLFQTYGFPLEITEELVREKGIEIDKELFRSEFKKHQDLSRTASAGMFKGGLADHSEDVTKLHTATHLLQKSLQVVLGSHVRQEGSNITAERLRFDYFSPTAPTDQELKEVENMINQKIKEDLAVTKTIEDKNDAINSGATAFFKENYPEKVSVYTIGSDVKANWFSKELCGGPHVDSTGKIGAVTIKKDKSIGTNIRRIYVELALDPAHGNQKHSRKD